MASEAKATQQHARILTHVTERERIIYSRIEQHYAHCTQQEAITAKPSPTNQPSTRLLFVNVPTSTSRHKVTRKKQKEKEKENKTKRIKKKQKNVTTRYYN